MGFDCRPDEFLRKVLCLERVKQVFLVLLILLRYKLQTNTTDNKVGLGRDIDNVFLVVLGEYDEALHSLGISHFFS